MSFQRSGLALTFLLGASCTFAVSCGVGGSTKGALELRPTAAGSKLVPHWELAHRSRPVSSMAFSEDGSEGWAIGPGVVLRLKAGQWVFDADLASEFESSPGAVWASPSGDVWFTDNLRLHLLRAGHFRWWRIPAPQIGPRSPSVHEASDENSVWIVQPNGRVLLFEHEEFLEKAAGEEVPELDPSSFAPGKAISWFAPSWVEPSGASAWAIKWSGLATASRRFDRDALTHQLMRFNGHAWTPQPIVGANAEAQVNSVALTRAGLNGAGVGAGGLVFSFQNGIWLKDEEASKLSKSDLRAVRLSSLGDQGWAVGDGGVVLSRRSGHAWTLDAAASALTQADLAAIWITPDGSLGWIADRRGNLLLTLAKGRWQVVRDPLRLTNDPLSQVGCGLEESWAASPRGELLVHRNNKWAQKIGPDAPEISWPAIWLDLARGRGWAIGPEGRVRRWTRTGWKADATANSLTNKKLAALAFSGDGQRGWAVGEAGTALRYESGSWRADTGPAELTTASIGGIWLEPDGKSGWASTGDRTLRIENGVWRWENGLSYVSGLAAAGSASSTPGATAWATSYGQVAYRFQHGRWERAAQVSGAGAKPLGIWLSPDASTGWMVGPGRFLWLHDGQWLLDRQPGLITQAIFRDVCMAPDLKTGWAVGDSGTILRYAAKPIVPAELRSESEDSIGSLRGSWRLRFGNDVREPLNPVLVEGNRTTPLSPDYEIRSTARPREFILKLDAPSLAERLKGSRQSLQIEARMVHPSLPITAVFRSDSFYIKERPLWQKVCLSLSALFGINLALVFLAIPVRWIRKVVLHPAGLMFPGLIVGKFVFFDWLICFVQPIKLAMFRDYRKRLAASSLIGAWRIERRYIPPQVYLDMSPTQVTRTMDEPTLTKEAWQRVFLQLLAQSRRHLWLITGPSGLGKTALLENWTGLALQLKRTPLLIRLRGSGDPREEAASLMAQHGDIDVKPEVALDLLKGGGFVILLDAFNEDRTPEATREFVRLVVQRNLVVMTSQFDPPWKDDVDTQQIHLGLFGKEQLTALLGEDRANQLLNHPTLARVAQLPYSAQLLARYVERRGEFPAAELEIYGDLMAGLDQAMLLNLEDAAWRRFKINDAELSPGAGIPHEFCEAATEAGVLTRRARGEETSYRFAHERIHRFLVASWLSRQDKEPLGQWYEELQPGLGRGYLGDVLDFWGQMWARRALQGQAACTAYLAFMKEVAQFKLAIFAQRLYPHYDRLCAAGLLPVDHNFTEWAARELAGAVLEDAA